MLRPSLPPVSDVDAFVEAVLSSGGDDSFDWQPFPGRPQEAAYHCTADVIGFGGAAGGGKTDLALGKAFTRFYRSIIFRREYPRLRAVIDRGDQIQDGRCRYVAGEKKHWRTPDGRTVELGAVEHEHNKVNYKGRPHDFIVFDEADEFPESVIRFITGWLRTERPDIKPQVLLTFNPPTTPEGEWIVRYFAPWIDPNYQGQRAQSGEWRWFVTVGDQDVEVSDGQPVIIEGQEYTPQSRVFIRAQVEDNPVYMATGYDKQLESLPEPLRSQLRYSDFSTTVRDDQWQAIPTDWIIQAQNRYLENRAPDTNLLAVGVDPSRGGSDETVICLLKLARFDLLTYAGQSVPNGAIAAKLVSDAIGTDNPPIAVDVIGIGSSVYDHLAAMPNIEVYAINVGEASNARDKTGRYEFFNLRSQLVWQLREMLDPTSGHNLELPPDVQLRNDLRAPRYSVVGGKIKIESKDDIRRRIGRSPDRGDAVMLAAYIAYNRPKLTVGGVYWW